MRENTSKCRERKREREREKRKGEREREKERDRDRDEKLYGRMTKRSKRAEAGVWYATRQRCDPVCGPAARALLTSLRNVKKNPRILPPICQKVIRKYPKG